jgi:hypothetical protein
MAAGIEVGSSDSRIVGDLNQVFVIRMSLIGDLKAIALKRLQEY